MRTLFKALCNNDLNLPDIALLNICIMIPQVVIEPYVKLYRK